MKSRLRAALTIILLLNSVTQAYALRCSNRIIQIGDRTHRVLQLCGEPSYVDEYDRALGIYPYLVQHVEVWTYNFGRSRFMQELQFENGSLRRINTLGYGY